MKLLSRSARKIIMQKSGVYLKYATFLNRSDFTLWYPSRYGGMDRVNVNRKIVSDAVK